MSSGHNNRGRNNNNRRARHGGQPRNIQSQPVSPRRVESVARATTPAPVTPVKPVIPIAPTNEPEQQNDIFDEGEDVVVSQPPQPLPAYEQPVALSGAAGTVQFAGNERKAEHAGNAATDTRAPQLIPPTPPASPPPSTPSTQAPTERGAPSGSIRAPFAPGQHPTHSAPAATRQSAPSGSQNGHVAQPPATPTAATDPYEAAPLGAQRSFARPAAHNTPQPERPTNDTENDTTAQRAPGTGERWAGYPAASAHVEHAHQEHHEHHAEHPTAWDRQGHGEQDAHGGESHERDVRGDVGPLIDSLHELFERDRSVASQGGVARCGICYLHFRLSDLHYREEEGFYVCANCARALGHNRIMMVRRQQHT